MRTKLLKIAIGMSKVAIYAMIICQSFTMAMGTETEAQQKLLKEIGVDLNVNDGKGALLNLIAELEEKSGFHFAYSKESLKDLSVEVPAGNWKMDHLLKEISVQGRLSIRRVNSTITLMPVEENESLPMIEEGFSQQTISGKITDEDGEALPGASVVVKGTTNGTTTDIDGLFNLNCPEDAVITVSFVGYQTQEIAVNNRSVIDLQLSLDLDQLDEVVVVGYGQQKKVNVTGAVSSVEMDKVLGDRPVTDAAKALQGAIPGLQITYGSGQPGSGTDINIRGFESINGGQPLVLVDNVPMRIEDINPRDIESVSVLKDAASTAVYGARAAFGVVLITTKKGKKNQPLELNYSTTLGWNSPSTYAEKASPRDLVQALDDWGQATFWTGQNIDTWLDYIDEYNSNPSAYPEGIITDTDGTKYVVKGSNAVEDLLNNPGFQQLHNLSISGGADKSAYRLSLGMTDEDGIMAGANDTYKRYNANLSLTSDITDRLTTTLNMIYKHGLRRDPASGDWRQMYKDAINYSSTVPSGYGTLENGEVVPYRTPANQVQLSPVSSHLSEVIRFFGKASYQVTDDININGEYTFERRHGKAETPSFTPGWIHPITFNYQPYNANNTSYRAESFQSDYRALNVYGNYSKTFGAHGIKLLLGMNREENEISSFSASRQGLLSPDVPGLSSGVGVLDANDTYSDYGVVGFFGRFNYSFDEKYLLEFNGRYDGSSRFPKESRFGFFPSVSGAWRLSNESFMNPLSGIVSNMKIRGSYGEIGNQDISNYGYLPTMNSYNVDWISSNTGINAVSLSQPKLVSGSFTWERVRTLDIGVDLGFFDDRLTANVDWFNRQTLDMLAPGSELPAVLGGSPPLSNVADLSNKGWELSMLWRDDINEFDYSLGFNLFDSRTEITDYDNEEGLLNQYYVGQQIGEIWGYVTQGFYTVDDFESESLNSDLTGGVLLDDVAPFEGTNPNPGDIRYRDLNGDGVVNDGNNTLMDPGDQQIIGNSTRRFQFGFTGSASYKNFDLSIFVQGIGKRDLWYGNSPEIFPFTHRWTTVYAHQLDYWMPDNTDAFYPRNYAYGLGNYRHSRKVQTKYLLNGAYLRLKNITIGYSLPQNLLDRLKISRLRVFVTGENLINLDHLPDGLDPELSKVTGSEGNYPFLKNYSVGLNVTF